MWRHGRYRSHTRSPRSSWLNWILWWRIPKCWWKACSPLWADFCGSHLHVTIWDLCYSSIQSIEEQSAHNGGGWSCHYVSPASQFDCGHPFATCGQHQCCHQSRPCRPSFKVQGGMAWHFWSITPPPIAESRCCRCYSCVAGHLVLFLIFHLHGTTADFAWSGHSRCYGQYGLCRFGGVAFFPDGSCVWFQLRISLPEAKAHWSWVGTGMQRHIAVWQLLAQFILTSCIASHLPSNCGPVKCRQGTERLNGRWHVYAEIAHIPGHLNDLADALSRFEPPSCPWDPAAPRKIDWRNLTND